MNYILEAFNWSDGPYDPSVPRPSAMQNEGVKLPDQMMYDNIQYSRIHVQTSLMTADFRRLRQCR